MVLGSNRQEHRNLLGHHHHEIAGNVLVGFALHEQFGRFIKELCVCMRESIERGRVCGASNDILNFKVR